MPSFLRFDSTVMTLGLAALLALGVSALATYLPHNSNGAQKVVSTGSVPAKTGKGAEQPKRTWQASAPGRVQPKGGEVRVVAEGQGVVKSVYAKVNDRVTKGDLLATLKSEEAESRLEAAHAEVRVRIAERADEEEDGEGEKDENKNKITVEWHSALDNLAAAERRLHKARLKFDTVFLARRIGQAKDADAEAARKAIDTAKELIAARRLLVRDVEANKDLPPSTRLDSGLAIARSDLRLAELAYEKTRLRATADGTILQLGLRAGETVSPTSGSAIAIIGNTKALEVKAEVEERDIQKVRLGQKVVVRSNAFEGQDFSGKVTRVSSRVGSPGLGLRGRNKPRDVEILEVKILLDGQTPLLSGMRVDVFFEKTQATRSAAALNSAKQ